MEQKGHLKILYGVDNYVLDGQDYMDTYVLEVEEELKILKDGMLISLPKAMVNSFVHDYSQVKESLEEKEEESTICWEHRTAELRTAKLGRAATTDAGNEQPGRRKAADRLAATRSSSGAGGARRRRRRGSPATDDERVGDLH
ncbi:hypothetical protein Scep_029828 [Stephania cephalantha]|uniref:Uncharacterized protein n=1 Tax=Stephania cephalantha TaxID=152367 RepID=A0AAP0E2Y2_9MAGN